MNLLSEQLQCPVRWIRGEGGGEKAADVVLSSEVFRGWVKSGKSKSGSGHKKKKSANFRSTDLSSSAYTLINYQQTLTQITFCFFLCSYS